MESLRILITGHLGYVGSSVIKEIKAKFPNSTLIGFDTGYFGSAITGDKVPESYLDEQYFGDIRNFPSWLLENIGVVVHLAAISNDPMGNGFADATWEINYEASCKLAEKASDAGVSKFIFASSCSVYGYPDNSDDILDEDSEKRPLTDYAKSKLATEEWLKEFSKETEMNISCLRFATACGFSDRLRLDLVLNDFVASAITRKKININSDGKPWRPIISTEDMGRAIVWGILRETSEYIVVNVGKNEDNYSVIDIAELVQKHTYDRYSTDIFVNNKAAPDKRSYRVSFNKFQNLAKWDENSTMDDTIKNLVKKIENLNLDSNYGNGKLIRLNQLNDLIYNNFLDKNLYWKK
jgi:nucleoside-diphosphate-sugar epimerase